MNEGAVQNGREKNYRDMTFKLHKIHTNTNTKVHTFSRKHTITQTQIHIFNEKQKFIMCVCLGRNAKY